MGKTYEWSGEQILKLREAHDQGHGMSRIFYKIMDVDRDDFPGYPDIEEKLMEFGLRIAGSPRWTDEEDEIVRKAYRDGLYAKDIHRLLGRIHTIEAILMRGRKLGLTSLHSPTQRSKRARAAKAGITMEQLRLRDRKQRLQFNSRQKIRYWRRRKDRFVRESDIQRGNDPVFMEKYPRTWWLRLPIW